MIFWAQIFIVFLASCGFTLAYYIYSTKKTSAPLTCPLEGSCEQVVHSTYSKILGIPVEVLGMLYYLFVGIFYSLSAFASFALPDFVPYAMIGITILAFLFSLYLTGVQTFVLKHWCTWCLFSAGICTVIVILTIYISNTKVVFFLHEFLR